MSTKENLDEVEEARFHFLYFTINLLLWEDLQTHIIWHDNDCSNPKSNHRHKKNTSHVSASCKNWKCWPNLMSSFDFIREKSWYKKEAVNVL